MHMHVMFFKEHTQLLLHHMTSFCHHLGKESEIPYIQDFMPCHVAPTYKRSGLCPLLDSIEFGHLP